MTNVDILTVHDEDSIALPSTKINLDRFPETEPERAWELANLIRIAATDFQYFSNWFSGKDDSDNTKIILEEGKTLEGIGSNKSWIYASNDISNSTLKDYMLFNDGDNEMKNYSDDDFYKYEILKTYEFVSYYPHRMDVDIDRFGFIARRKVEGKNLIFIIFRGTREPSEWFNNAQFGQIDFLTTDSNKTGFPKIGKISRGFNKMYTSFRPGLWVANDQLNSASQMISKRIRDLIQKNNGFNIEEVSLHKAISDFLSNYADLPSENTHLYVSGHSLGGALATIAAMDIVSSDQGLTGSNREEKLKNPVRLYTFASPRVGDNSFADKCNEFIAREKLHAFRFANSEDLVTNVPLPVWLKAGIDTDENKMSILDGLRKTFNLVTGNVFESDYQHVGQSISFTHQARRTIDGELAATATLGDNHNMAVSYCGALPTQ